jgi:hypothetical protein
MPSERLKIEDYPSTLAHFTLIILFSETLKFSKIISSKSENIVKDNSEFLRIFTHSEIHRRGLPMIIKSELGFVGEVFHLTPQTAFNDALLVCEASSIAAGSQSVKVSLVGRRVRALNACRALFPSPVFQIASSNAIRPFGLAHTPSQTDSICGLYLSNRPSSRSAR